MQAFYDIASVFLNIVKYVIFAHFIMSWLISFSVLNVNEPIVAQIWKGLSQLLDPLYAPVRRLLPDFGAIDLSPVVVLFGIFALQRILFFITFGA